MVENGVKYSSFLFYLLSFILCFVNIVPILFFVFNESSVVLPHYTTFELQTLLPIPRESQVCSNIETKHEVTPYLGMRETLLSVSKTDCPFDRYLQFVAEYLSMDLFFPRKTGKVQKILPVSKDTCIHGSVTERSSFSTTWVVQHQGTTTQEDRKKPWEHKEVTHFTAPSLTFSFSQSDKLVMFSALPWS